MSIEYNVDKDVYIITVHEKQYFIDNNNKLYKEKLIKGEIIRKRVKRKKLEKLHIKICGMCHMPAIDINFHPTMKYYSYSMCNLCVLIRKEENRLRLDKRYCV